MRTAGSNQSTLGPTPSPTLPAWQQAEYWRYTTRLVPWTLTATSILLGAAWAIRTHLDTANERSVLAVISTISLCAVFDDDAGVITSATPTPLWARRMPRAVIPLSVLAVAWALMVVGVAARRTGTVESAPVWATTLEWFTVAVSQLVVGAIASRRPGASGSIAPGLLVALVWLTAEGAPMLHRQMHPVRSHPALWCALLFVALSAIAVAAQERRWRS